MRAQSGGWYGPNGPVAAGDDMTRTEPKYIEARRADIIAAQLRAERGTYPRTYPRTEPRDTARTGRS